MIHIDNVRVLLRNHRTAGRSAERVARSTMEHLAQMVPPELEHRGGSRVLERAQGEPLRISNPDLSEDALARLIARHAWQSIVRHL